MNAHAALCAVTTTATTAHSVKNGPAMARGRRSENSPGASGSRGGSFSWLAIATPSAMAAMMPLATRHPRWSLMAATNGGPATTPTLAPRKALATDFASAPRRARLAAATGTTAKIAPCAAAPMKRAIVTTSRFGASAAIAIETNRASRHATMTRRRGIRRVSMTSGMAATPTPTAYQVTRRPTAASLSPRSRVMSGIAPTGYISAARNTNRPAASRNRRVARSRTSAGEVAGGACVPVIR